MVSRDNFSNIFAKEEDVTKLSLAKATQRGLLELNSSSYITVFQGDLYNNMENTLKDFNIVIITNLIPMAKAENINSFCRKNNIGFIYSCQIGFFSFLFEDFGEDFIISDKDGKKCKKYFVKSISNSCPGIVEIDPLEVIEKDKKKKKFLKFETGNYVIFRGVSGMTELNNVPPRPIKILSKNKFTIEETSGYDKFLGTGIVEEYKFPYPAKFLSLSQAINVLYFDDFQENGVDGIKNVDNDMNKIIDEKIFDMEYDEILGNEIKSDMKNNYEWMNIFNTKNKNETLIKTSNSKMHLALLGLHEYYLKNKRMPKYNDQFNVKDCISLCSGIFSKAKEEKKMWAKELKEVDVKYLTNIFKYCEFSFSPLNKYFGGVVAQETLKYIGLYKPACQWVYFNFLELLDNDISFIDRNQIKSYEKRNVEIYFTPQEEKIKLLKQTKIVIIGFNDVAFEILHFFMKLNLSENIVIVDLDNNENYVKIMNLMGEYEFNVIVDGNIINGISKKDFWKNSKIIIETLSHKLNSKEKDLLIANAKKDNKILISVNAHSSNGSFELILPNEITKKKSNSTPSDEYKTPDGENIKIQNSIDEEKKYKNVLNEKDSLNLSKNIFENYFGVYIKFLNELINRSNSGNEMLKYIDGLIKNEKNKETIFKLFRYLKKLLSAKKDSSFESVVFTACEMFQELFQFAVDEILFKYPLDFVELGKHKKFWSGKRYPPKPILFDINKNEHYELLCLITYFLSKILGVDNFEKKMAGIKSYAQKYATKEYDSSLIYRARNQKFFNIEKNSLIRLISVFAPKSKKFRFKEIKLDLFEDGDINNFEKMGNQLKFIIMSSNMFLENYGIKPSNSLYKPISILLNNNNILPTTSSSISALVFLQLLLMFNDQDFIEFISSSKGKENETKDQKYEIENDCSSMYNNINFNLALNVYLSYNIIKK